MPPSIQGPSEFPSSSSWDLSNPIGDHTLATLGVAGYIIRNFYPNAITQLKLHPRLARFLSMLLAMWAFGPYAYSKLKSLWGALSFYGTSRIEISSDDDLYPHLRRWLSHRRAFYLQQDFGVSSLLKQFDLLQKFRKRKQTSDHDDYGEEANDDNALQDQFKVGSWVTDESLQFDPLEVLPFFVYKWRLFHVIYSSNMSTQNERRKITLSCFGRSLEPLNDILKTVIFIYNQSQTQVTIVRRPAPDRYGNPCLQWQKVSEKPQRAMDSVNLDAEQKASLIADMDSYVAGKTASWYKAHCVPYRRGYLFWGPPGCGKSSMALALAGKYQCDIYMVSLRDAGMGDHTLLHLLKALPPKALVLLEDVDSAGLKRDSGDTYDEDDDDVDEYYHGNSRYRGRGQSTVTLSGLLNAIDGVDAPEGHILIMTSNTPEDLDEALIRSGRVSVKVEFKKATKALGKEMFVRMYKDVQIINPDLILASDELEKLSATFAGRLPDNELSLADLQDYMLTHKEDPMAAVEELETWIHELKLRKAEEAAKKLRKKEKRRRARERERRRAARHERTEVVVVPMPEDASEEESEDSQVIDEEKKEEGEMRARQENQEQLRSRSPSSSRDSPASEDGASAGTPATPKTDLSDSEERILTGKDKKKPKGKLLIVDPNEAVDYLTLDQVQVADGELGE